jgi:hypothetical protein
MFVFVSPLMSLTLRAIPKSRDDLGTNNRIDRLRRQILKKQ